MLEELKNVIQENHIEFYIDDITSKHGMLEIAYHPHNNKIDLVLKKYKEKSKNVCVICGDIATNHLWDINAPYCDRCKHELPDF
jgi:2-keto-3-deoxy-galactonokinase